MVMCSLYRSIYGDVFFVQEYGDVFCGQERHLLGRGPEEQRVQESRGQEEQPHRSVFTPSYAGNRWRSARKVADQERQEPVRSYSNEGIHELRLLTGKVNHFCNQ
jgi:hypothetical protein